MSDLSEVRKSALRSSYGTYYYRAIAGMMLWLGPAEAAHRRLAQHDRREPDRQGGQFQSVPLRAPARFLACANVVPDRSRDDRYHEGPNLDAFWKHDEKKLPEIARDAVLKYIDKHAGYLPKRATPLVRAHLIEFLTLFFACFGGRAVQESKLAEVLRGFSRLPREDLVTVAKELGINAAAVDPDSWSYWLDLKDGAVLIEALSTAEWLNGEEKNKTFWVFAGHLGLGMLGLDKPQPAPRLPDTIKAGTKLTVLAGTGLDWRNLLPLFRYCTIKKIDEVCEFQLDRKRMAQQPAGTSPGEELKKALEDLDPLPPAIAELLGTTSKLGGQIGIRGCSALMKPENEDVLKAIRQHSSLKGYLEPGAPPGYLIIKPASDPYNFIERCRMLGFTVTNL